MSKDCRFFLTEGAEHWQLFSFSQNKNDASIYVASPNFADIKWLTFVQAPDGTSTMNILDSPGDGKLSLHGSGVTHVRSHDGSADGRLVVSGNALKGTNTLGVRHMFTVLISKPEHLPLSPAFNRKTDQSVHAKKLTPYVFVFWAVPAVRRLTVEVAASFNVDDLETVPPESGWGCFGLTLHSVVWFAYRTKHMKRWPQYPHVSYHDGHTVPLPIGVQEGGCRLELRTPQYRLSEDALLIQM